VLGGKAMAARALTYPLAAIIVPVVWWVRGRALVVSLCARRAARAAVPHRRRRQRGEPLRHRDWWDDANHFVNWAIVVAAFGQLLLRLRIGRWEAFGLAVGFGAVTAMLWELAEYYTFIRHSSELRTAYTDMLGDLALGLGGSVLAATITVTLLWSWKNRHTVSQEP
jgi:hypothetical protein